MLSPPKTRRGLRPRIACLWVGLAMALAGAAGAAGGTPVSGRLLAIWGDSPLGPGGGSRLVWTLVTDAGDNLPLELSEEQVASIGGPFLANGSRVAASLEVEPGASGQRLTVSSLLLTSDAGPRLGADAGPMSRAVIGAQPWVSILCKFGDVAVEPRNLSYFQSMFDDTAGRLDHYWREVSYDTANVAGSTAAGWVVLSNPQTFYVPTPGSGCLDGIPGNDANLPALFADCTAAADSLVDFSAGGTGGFVGINLMFNSDLDGCAWGGGHFATLDGVSKVWRTTWEPPWGYFNVTVMAHEMGHGFGLPHSNNWDADGWPYDNTWDVMSDSYGYTIIDLIYGTLGKHTIAHHKDVLGWVPPAQKLIAPASGQFTVVVDDLALATTPNYRMVEIPVSSGFDAWTVEVRGPTGLYDGQLPTKAVIIHQVDVSRSEPAWCHDAAVPPGDEADGEGSLWRVGETFVDAAHQVQVTVDAETAQGFRLTIGHGDPNSVFADGFESGDTSGWTTP